MATIIDIDARWTPSLLHVTALTAHGECWLLDRIEGEATWIGDTWLVEHRFGPDLLLGAHDDGLTVALDGCVADAARS